MLRFVSKRVGSIFKFKYRDINMVGKLLWVFTDTKGNKEACLVDSTNRIYNVPFNDCILHRVCYNKMYYDVFNNPVNQEEIYR